MTSEFVASNNNNANLVAMVTKAVSKTQSQTQMFLQDLSRIEAAQRQVIGATLAAGTRRKQLIRRALDALGNVTVAKAEEEEGRGTRIQPGPRAEARAALRNMTQHHLQQRQRLDTILGFMPTLGPVRTGGRGDAALVRRAVRGAAAKHGQLSRRNQQLKLNLEAGNPLEDR